MRDAFANEITTLAEQDPRIVLLSGDIGNRMFNPFKDRFADRFYNCGVAEASMMSIAAGLAMSGMRPVVYSIVPFVTTRCLEQIRVDLCYHRQPVIIIGVGGGFSYASLGATHHSCEDIAMLRVLPEISVVCPGDALEVRGALRAAFASDGPVYLRIGKKGEPVVHETEPDFTIGQSITVRAGGDVCLLAVGNVLPIATAAAKLLVDQNISARVESFHTVKPLDRNCLNDVFNTCRIVATVEEHSKLGGAGGAVAEWLSEQSGPRARLLRFGSEDEFVHESGSQDFARQAYGLTPQAIANAVAEEFESTG